jgi:hypothetical protein
MAASKERGKTMRTAAQIRAEVRMLGDAYYDFGADMDDDVYELAEAEVLEGCTEEEVAAYEKAFACTSD